MTDTSNVSNRKLSRFLILALVALVAIAGLAWWFSRDTNDGPVTGVTEDNVPVFEGTPPDAVGVGAPVRELPGANNSPTATLGTDGGDNLTPSGETATPQTNPLTPPAVAAEADPAAAAAAARP